MLIPIALACLLGPAAAYPIVQKDVLDELVTQSSLDRVSNPANQQTIIPDIAVVLPVTELPAVPAVPSDGQQIGTEQMPTHSSSESESSEQSQSVETTAEPSSENTSENTAEEPDPHTSEQTSESQDVTSEDTTSEETPSPLEIQLLGHTASDGDLGDDSQGSEEHVQKSWLHAFRRNFHRQIYGGNIVGGVATDPPVTEVAKGTVAMGVTVGATVASAVSSDVPAAPATEAVVMEMDSAASESKESEEKAELNEWRECREMSETGDCSPHAALSDDGKIEDDLHHGGLQLEEELGHMTI